ncbi:Na+-transporting methylmalonyl-CoA/oxaloacetate decarboxylase gamma subunit [Arcanobacterium pluranimalium]|uniref:DUF5067 domain-containing protein n=1 Tax=Arcanobacterium pluranimalium TaxID=108028 RepID=UPI00195932DA|nr:DUF5067 domain-containing protein [Arcanobacterium pluranimalium]MBM7824803.1 Na+-transporting methylmalonyl-CoA/oxaloacetate decarboxylase gamma subunit [Arcanobacterium pluranimalium]
MNYPAPGAKPTSAGFGIASLVLGIIAILGSFIPVLNIGSIILAIIGLILGLVGLSNIKKGRAHGKGMTIVGVVLCVLSIVIAIFSNVVFTKAVDKAIEESRPTNVAKSESTTNDKSSDAAKDKGSDSGKNKYSISVTGTKLTTDYSGAPALLVTYAWKNLSDKEASFIVEFRAKAFQNGVELESAIGKEPGLGEQQMASVQPGADHQVGVLYKLKDQSEVQIQVKPTFSFSDDKLIDQKVMPK